MVGRYETLSHAAADLHLVTRPSEYKLRLICSLSFSENFSSYILQALARSHGPKHIASRYALAQDCWSLAH